MSRRLLISAMAIAVAAAPFAWRACAAETGKATSYRFESLAGKSPADLERFMGGEPAAYHTGRDKVAPYSFPAPLWDLEPEAAARAYLKANLPSRTRIPPGPKKKTDPRQPGWIVLDESTSGCFYFGSFLVALHHGIGNPFIVRIGRGQGMAGDSANPFKERVTHEVVIIPLSAAEADFIASVTFHLRDLEPGLAAEELRAISSTSDGFASVDFITLGSIRRLEGITWDISTGGSLEYRVQRHYDDEAKLNFIHKFFTITLPERLGNRWSGKEAGSPGGPMRTAMEILRQDQASPWPAAVIREVAGTAGDAGWQELITPLKELLATLPAPTKTEAELGEIQRIDAREFRKFATGAGATPAGTTALWERRLELEKELRHHRPTQLRPYLQVAIPQMEAIPSPALLLDLAMGDGDSSRWAERQLRERFPSDLAPVLVHNFHRYPPYRLRNFEELVTIAPVEADRLRTTMTAELRGRMLLTSAKLDLALDPAAAGVVFENLLDAFTDPKTPSPERTHILEELAKLKPATGQQARLEQALLEEIQRKDSSENRSFPGTCARILVRQPEPDRFWLALLETPGNPAGHGEAEALREALAELALAAPGKRMKAYGKWLEPAFRSNSGPMEKLLNLALALDLREFSETIAKLANTGPEAIDGEGARSSGGSRFIPGAERYHRARHVTALWKEKDPNTLARMWVALLKNDPYCFAGDSLVPSRLRDRCGAAIAGAAEDVRTKTALTLREVKSGNPELTAWLKGVAP